MAMATVIETDDEARMDEASGCKLPPDIAVCLRPDQVTRVERMLTARTVPHPVDYRVSSSLFGHRFYVAFFAGTESRSWERLRAEQQVRSLSSVLRDGAVVSIMVTLALCLLVGVGVVGAMLLKSMTGIDLLGL